MKLVIQGKPIGKGRPRMTKGEGTMTDVYDELLHDVMVLIKRQSALITLLDDIIERNSQLYKDIFDALPDGTIINDDFMKQDGMILYRGQADA